MTRIATGVVVKRCREGISRERSRSPNVAIDTDTVVHAISKNEVELSVRIHVCCDESIRVIRAAANRRKIYTRSKRGRSQGLTLTEIAEQGHGMRVNIHDSQIRPAVTVQIGNRRAMDSATRSKILSCCQSRVADRQDVSRKCWGKTDATRRTEPTGCDCHRRKQGARRNGDGKRI